MLWPATLAVHMTPAATAPSPVDTAIGYLLSYGVLGVVALALAFRFIVPRSALDDARTQARADLAAENERLIREKTRAEEQRDDALKIAQDKILPTLVQFTAATGALLPVLQQIAGQHANRGPGR